MLKTVLPSILLFAIAGCGGESRIESPAGIPAGEAPEGSEKARASKAAPRKSSPSASRLEAAGSAGAKGAGEKAKRSPSPDPAPREGKAAEAKQPKGPPAGEAAAIIRDLKRDPRSARDAFLKIWEVPRSLIPRLIEEVENEEPSKLERIEVLVLDPDFLRPGELKPFLANRIHGLGRMEVLEEVEKDDLGIVSQEYTKMSYGITRNKHYKVVLDKFGGFPVGVVVRAGLINRFRSTRYPPSSDDEAAPGKLTEWWRAFYARAKAEMKDAPSAGLPREDRKG